MRLIIFILLFFCATASIAQVTQTAIVATTVQLKNYNGSASLVFVSDSAYQGLYYIYNGSMPADEHFIFAGSTGKKWRLQSINAVLGIPRGTTAERPASPSIGYLRYNTDLSRLEIFDNTSNWKTIPLEEDVSSIVSDSLATHVFGNIAIDSVAKDGDTTRFFVNGVLRFSLPDSIGPGGPGSISGYTKLVDSSLSGLKLYRQINDSVFVIKSIVLGTNMGSSYETDNTVVLNSTPGTAEINAQAFTLSTTGFRSVDGDQIIEYIMVKPVGNLTAFKVGTLFDDDAFAPGTPIVADGTFTIIVIDAHITAPTNVYFTGITSTCDIKIITKALHE